MTKFYLCVQAIKEGFWGEFLVQFVQLRVWKLFFPGSQ